VKETQKVIETNGLSQARYCPFQTDDKPEMSKKRGKKILEGFVCGIKFDNIRYL